MALGLEGKRIVITGGSGGLGSAVVEAFAAAGAICYLPQLRKTPDARRGVEVFPDVDLSKEADVTELYARLPPLWASVHLAGGYAGGAFVDTTLEGFLRQLGMNVTTAFLCCREAIRSMRRDGGGGRIVNVCSKAALEPSGGAVAYAVSKAGVVALTRSLAEEVKVDGILVNAVAPSIIDTPANRAAMPKSDPSLWPKPAEIARTMLWLASPENGLTSGAVIPVYGSS